VFFIKDLAFLRSYQNDMRGMRKKYFSYLRAVETDWGEIGLEFGDGCGK
jgi:hypothetical protein